MAVHQQESIVKMKSEHIPKSRMRKLNQFSTFQNALKSHFFGNPSKLTGMFELIRIISLPFWQILLFCLAAFILGLSLGWLLWGIFRRRYKIALNERDDFASLTSDLETKINDCWARTRELQDMIDILRKRQARTETPGSGGNSKIQAVYGIHDTRFEKLENSNLHIIEGIGPKISDFLVSQGITNWKKLSECDPDELRDLLDKSGGRYRIIDPSTWPKQALLAAQGNWQELIELQKHLSGGKEKGGMENDSKVEKIMIRLGFLKKWKKDDLKAIEGIGPKIEKLLQGAGISSWQILAESRISTLREILEQGGPKYQLADPSTWPGQAKLANEGKWHELMELQDRLKGGKRP
jgi:predicted flap endonuclease-1-like 5' DNA nuclease